MDLGCLDLCCISVSDKQGTEATLASSESREDTATASSKIGKNKSPKETAQSTSNILNKFTSQIKKPSHRKSSPLNWFPRTKVDSYLKRKIKMLQEVDGMNLTLDETLGDANPHYSRVLREKMAAREAAHKAMEARKAALVEASWCRILRAARIQNKDAEAQLLKAEKSAAAAFEAATSIGVIMYDIPNCPRKPCQIETSSVNGGGSAKHKVTASFETAFEVDIEVAAAVKIALIRLANCATFNKDEFEELLRKISQNPDTGENNRELSEFSSECESESESELETASLKDDFSCQEFDCNLPAPDMRQRKNRKRLSFERFNTTKLVEMMLERLRCLQEDELSSLATIVATCGLNAALAEVTNSKAHDSTAYSSNPAPNLPRRMSSMGAGNHEVSMDGHTRRKQVESELPSLDKFLVKHMTKLEKEVWEAKNSRNNESGEGTGKNSDRTAVGEVNLDNDVAVSETIPDFGSILLKHSSKLEKEIEEAKKRSGREFETDYKKLHNDRSSSEAVPDLGTILIKHCSKLEKEIEETKKNNGKAFEMNGKKFGRVQNGDVGHTEEDVPEVPSLEKFLVKRVSRLEKEVQEAKNRRKNEPRKGGRVTNMKTKFDSSASDAQLEKTTYSDGGAEQKENIDSNNQKECTGDTGESPLQIGQVNLNAGDVKIETEDQMEDSLDKILVKPLHKLEGEKIQALPLGSNYGSHRHQKKQAGNSVTDCESLDKILVKHVSRLEKEKMRFSSKEEMVKVKKSCETKVQSHLMNPEGGLDQILVKHKSRLEREKLTAAQQPDDQIKHSKVRREARERELQEAWGGLSLGNSMKSSETKVQQSHMNQEGGLDQILVKHKSILEREKLAAAQQPDGHIRHSMARREARERELQEAWGGLSLGNSMKPHLSKLEQDKAAWIKAEEEERKEAIKDMYMRQNTLNFNEENTLRHCCLQTDTPDESQRRRMAPNLSRRTNTNQAVARKQMGSAIALNSDHWAWA
ncbi:uncharacterized protein LOC132177473 [Corylus avellana]|uniref:uncharacterized protein LOC132177473 n=1 Tax=Corylus avellana TaxID=13451 RepID=UPI00286ACD35|nr:uncharacterized protein LOC132177473 [Corylus avellana]